MDFFTPKIGVIRHLCRGKGIFMSLINIHFVPPLNPLLTKEGTET